MLHVSCPTGLIMFDEIESGMGMGAKPPQKAGGLGGCRPPKCKKTNRHPVNHHVVEMSCRMIMPNYRMHSYNHVSVAKYVGGTGSHPRPPGHSRARLTKLSTNPVQRFLCGVALRCVYSAMLRALCITMTCIALLCVACLCLASHYFALLSEPLACSPEHGCALHCFALLRTALVCSALPCWTLFYFTLAGFGQLFTVNFY